MAVRPDRLPRPLDSVLVLTPISCPSCRARSTSRRPCTTACARSASARCRPLPRCPSFVVPAAQQPDSGRSAPLPPRTPGHRQRRPHLQGRQGQADRRRGRAALVRGVRGARRRAAQLAALHRHFVPAPAPGRADEHADGPARLEPVVRRARDEDAPCERPQPVPARGRRLAGASPVAPLHPARSRSVNSSLDRARAILPSTGPTGADPDTLARRRSSRSGTRPT